MESADAATPQPRVILGRYRIEKTLGRGGMGEVLLARDELLNRPVALKRLDPQGEDRAARRRGILKEARRVSAISDRRIAAIYDVVDLDDEVMLVMEYVDGVTLRRRMEDPVAIEDFWSLATQCVEGVAVAHAHGVIHRDLKPENFMVTRAGEVKVLDFGIAKRAEADGETTTTTGSDSRSGRIAGTPYYMAPEAHVGAAVDERTDIFSLGVVFYELLTSRRPFEGGNYAVVVNQVLNAEPADVETLNPAVGRELSRVVGRMLAKSQADRIPSATELLRQMKSARLGMETPGRDGGERAALAGAAGTVVPGAVANSPGQAGAAMERSTVGTPATVVTPATIALPTPSLVATANRMRLALVALVLTGMVTATWRILSAPALPRDINLAVLPPATPGATADFANFALGAMEHVNNRLRDFSDTRSFQLASFADPNEEKVGSAADARKILGTNVALFSTLDQGPDVLRARLELREPKRDRVIASRVIEVPSQQPFEFLDRVYRESATMLHRAPRPGTAAARTGIRGAGTLRFYLQGRGRLRAATDSAQALAALADFESATRTEPDAAVAKAGLANAQLRVHQLTGRSEWLARADATSLEAVQLDDTRSETHRSRAMVLTTQKKMREGLTEYARAVEINPSDDDLALRLGRAYQRLGEPEKEKEVYLATIRRRPHEWQPYWWLATWHFRQGDLAESAHAYREMIRRAPQLSMGFWSLGGAQLMQGDYAGAIASLKHSIELRPTRAAFENLGTAYFNSGRFGEAVDAYNQSFQFGSPDYSNWLNLGDAYYWLRDRKAQAAEAYAQSIRLGRDQAAARARKGSSVDVQLEATLAMVFAKLGERDSARVYLAGALAADSTNPMVQYSAALTHWQWNDRERAIGWLEKSVHGGYPVVWLRDSPIFHEWRELSRFRALVGDTLTK